METSCKQANGSPEILARSVLVGTTRCRLRCRVLAGSSFEDPDEDDCCYEQLARKQPQTERAARKSKFQADLAPAEGRMVRGLKQELQLTSNTDFLSEVLFRWAVWERKRGHRILSETETGERKELVFPRLERVAPELALPRVEIPWTPRALESLADLASREPANPTETLIRAMRG